MKLRLKRRVVEVGEVISFIFESQDLTLWQAGQYINITMPDVPPAAADRLFTIASVPQEEEIRITTYLGRSLYKQRMATLKEGDIVEADQLGGDFVWQDDGRPKLYIAGGIGATTFRSIMLDRVSRGLPNNALLLYAGLSTRRPFVKEFKKFAAADPSLKIIDYVETKLSLDRLLKDVHDFRQRTIYLSGSQKFVETLGEGLMGLGVPRPQIKYDYFDGYEDIEY